MNRDNIVDDEFSYDIIRIIAMMDVEKFQRLIDRVNDYRREHCTCGCDNGWFYSHGEQFRCPECYPLETY